MFQKHLRMEAEWAISKLVSKAVSVPVRSLSAPAMEPGGTLMKVVGQMTLARMTAGELRLWRGLDASWLLSVSFSVGCSRIHGLLVDTMDTDPAFQAHKASFSKRGWRRAVLRRFLISAANMCGNVLLAPLNVVNARMAMDTQGVYTSSWHCFHSLTWAELFGAMPINIADGILYGICYDLACENFLQKHPYSFLHHLTGLALSMLLFPFHRLCFLQMQAPDKSVLQLCREIQRVEGDLSLLLPVASGAGGVWMFGVSVAAGHLADWATGAIFDAVRSWQAGKQPNNRMRARVDFEDDDDD